MFVETSAGIVRENVRVNIMQNKNIVRIALGTGLLLLIPLFAMQVSDEWNWGLFDFVFMGALLFGTGLTYELIARKGRTIAYRAAVGIACAAGLLLVGINAAVGLIGSEDNRANLMYFGVLAVGFIGVFIARFQPRGMSRALVATAVAQALVPLIALIWVPANFSPGVVEVFGLNACFVALWVVSALLFRHAEKRGGTFSSSSAAL
jgi:hypothetical protein